MKSPRKAAFLLPLLVVGLASAATPVQQTTAPAPSAPAKLPTLAVLRLESSRIDTADLEVLRDALTVELQNSGVVRVMERSQMNAILLEQGFQSSGSCDKSECAVEVGRLLAVDRMVLGTAGKIGDTWSVTLRLVNVETGEVAASVRDSRTGSIEVLLSQSVPKLSSELVQSMGTTSVAKVGAGSDVAFLEANLIIGDKTFRKPSGFERLKAISPGLLAPQSMMLYEKGSLSPSWAWANVYPFIPVGSMVQGDWAGVGLIYLAWVPFFATVSNESDATPFLALAAYGFNIGRPIHFASQSNAKLKQGLGLQPSAWIPSPSLLLSSSGDILPALTWVF